MKQIIVMTILVFGAVFTWAEEPALRLSADMELFYELSNDVGGSGDNDRFKSNQLYLIFDGEFDRGLNARLIVDGADVVSSHGNVVTEAIIEEANFTWKNIGDSLLSICFGKHEMAFSMDYDNYLNDSIIHMLELDKVWGVTATLNIPKTGSLAVSSHQHRNTIEADETRMESDNNIGDNAAAKLMIDKLVKNLSLVISGSAESYSSVSTNGGVTISTDKKDEVRINAGFIYTIGNIGNINCEYTYFENIKGMPDICPSLLTIGAEYNISDSVKAFGRWENIMDDVATPVENDFWTIGISYQPTDKYIFLAEYSNFNSADLIDAMDMNVAANTINDSLLLGVKAKF
ncbi:MAG: hypothetical protein JXN60_08920 [Lentisphaerae bacterium]|nr:hypothetical protein [Lentisphaerota bacterium]